MKRSFLYLALGALALSACTSEDVLEDAAKQHNAIGFENVVNKISRADVDNDNLEHFRVFGYYTTPLDNTVAVPVFENVRVDRQSDGTWKYQCDTVDYRYWVPDAHYYFYSYNCGNVDKLSSDFGTFEMDMTNGKRPADRVLKVNGYISDNTHQHDLIYASNTGATNEDPFAGIVGKKNSNPLVAFQFKHLLAKVQAQFTSKFPADYEVIISDVSLQNIRNIGNYNPNATNGWQSVLRKGTFPSVYLLNTLDKAINPITTKNGAAAAQTNTAYVIPYQYNGTTDASTGEVIDNDYVYIKFYINVKNKEQDVFSTELTGKFNANWQSGYTYTYNIEVSGSAANLDVIGFTTTTDEFGKVVTDWTGASSTIVIK